MDVRSGVSLWQSRVDVPPAAVPLNQDLSCEVVILGSGVTGALIAQALTKAGVSTVMIDRGEVAAGSTAASTGLLQYEVDNPLSKLIEQVGEQNAVHAYRRGLKAIDEIEQLASDLSIDCEFERRKSLYVASSRWHLYDLQKEYECRKSHGFEVSWLDRDELSMQTSIQSPGAILSSGDAQINPLAFTRSLLRQAVEDGLRMFANTEVLDVEESGDGVLVRTAGGLVAAKKIVYATGYDPAQKIVRQVGNLNSTYALATAPVDAFPGWPDGWLLWETARPYFYARQTTDRRIILGGGDTAFKNDHQRDGLLQRQIEKVTSKFRSLFPEIEFQVQYVWAGTFAETKDGLACIGQHPERPSAYFALGYGGNGITFSMIAARLITDLYFGKANPDAEVFRVDR
ncbi:MAG: FAD-dependent oxidoreductase [Planctomycetota bacterium]|nr:FAD-dependent oxidoreductase [Planctomycetota bacterium]